MTDNLLVQRLVLLRVDHIATLTQDGNRFTTNGWGSAMASRINTPREAARLPAIAILV
jgi:hypothetical protein